MGKFGLATFAVTQYESIYINMGDVFDQVLSNKQFQDTQEQLALILKAGDFMRLLCWKTRNEEPKYLHFCTTKLLQHQDEGSWEGKVNQLENTMRKNHAECQEQMKSLRKEMSDIKEILTKLVSPEKVKQTN